MNKFEIFKFNEGREKPLNNGKEKSLEEEYLEELSRKREDGINEIYEGLKDKLSSIDFNSTQGRKELHKLISNEKLILNFSHLLLETTPYNIEQKKDVNSALFGGDQNVEELRSKLIEKIILEGIDPQDKAEIPNFSRIQGILYQEILKRKNSNLCNEQSLNEDYKWFEKYFQNIAREIKTGKFNIEKYIPKREKIEKAA